LITHPVNQTAVGQLGPAYCTTVVFDPPVHEGHALHDVYLFVRLLAG